MKKIIALILFYLLLSGNAQAGTVGISGVWDFTSDTGVGFYNSSGLWESTSQLVGQFDFDIGSVSLQSTATFYGAYYFANGTISDNGDGTYNGNLDFLWGPSTTPSSLLWDITDHGDNTATVLTISGDAIIDGTLTSVPVPAAVWLFGSGLIGLAGVVGRRPNVIV